MRQGRRNVDLVEALRDSCNFGIRDPSIPGSRVRVPHALQAQAAKSWRFHARIDLGNILHVAQGLFSCLLKLLTAFCLGSLLPLQFFRLLLSLLFRGCPAVLLDIFVGGACVSRGCRPLRLLPAAPIRAWSTLGPVGVVCPAVPLAPGGVLPCPRTAETGRRTGTALGPRRSRRRKQERRDEQRSYNGKLPHRNHPSGGAKHTNLPGERFPSSALTRMHTTK